MGVSAATVRWLAALLVVAAFCEVLSLVNAADVTIRLKGSNGSPPGLRGSTATIVCGWTFDSTVGFVTLLEFSSTKRPDIYSYAVGNRFQSETAKGNDYDDVRMSTSQVNPDVMNVTLTLSDLECSDEDTYSCTVHWALIDGTAEPPKVSEATLSLQVPPSAPVITVLSGDLTNGVQEGDELVLRCKAKVGSQGKGRLHWRVYRGNGPDIMSTDQRVNTSTNKPHPLDCTDEITSDLAMRVTRHDQDLVVTCFVTNDDFAPSVRVTCEWNRLCDQTQRIHIRCKCEGRQKAQLI